MDPSILFSSEARRRYRNRAFDLGPENRWLIERMGTELAERLSVVRKSFADVLILGSDFGTFQSQANLGAAKVLIADPGNFADVQCDEDMLPFAAKRFDLIVSIGTLDTVNDLPGALLLVRRCLSDDGLFLGAMLGAGSLPSLKSCIAETGIARIHPQIDVRAAGDLLTRAGFLMPVAESETINVRYPDLFRLIGDLRANALTNALADRRALSRRELALMAARFAAKGTDKIDEQFAILTMTGWAATPPKSR